MPIKIHGNTGHIAWNKKPPKQAVCMGCGITFEYNPHSGKTGKYHSHECFIATRQRNKGNNKVASRFTDEEKRQRAKEAQRRYQEKLRSDKRQVTKPKLTTEQLIEREKENQRMYYEKRKYGEDAYEELVRTKGINRALLPPVTNKISISLIGVNKIKSTPQTLDTKNLE